ncbi:MATE efflux family protein 3, chloroplastic [Dorcoceras hygrometricum]|uniref:Protein DETOXIFICATION n=1 Tax=Dorcoceras hygrometricum TaxID=472368 RepID=A0A2Z7C0S7_9LAMI|nr:MATE efflux family protein 3, chloroplastic [Dorcoceras hygrometricum]
MAVQFSSGSSAWDRLTCWNRGRGISLHQSTGLRVHPGGENSGKQKVLYGRRFEACSLKEKGYLSCPLVRHRRHVLSRFGNHRSPDCEVQPPDVDESSAVLEESFISNSNGGHNELNCTASPGIINSKDDSREIPINTTLSKDVKHELVMLSLPAIGGQTIEPLTQLLETAFIGNLGSVELASAGVSISLFNIVSKLFNIPLLSVATSFVAEDISKNASRFYTSEKKLQLSSVSTALALAVGIGIFEAVALSLGSGPLLSLMGISPVSSMRIPAQRFLLLRALGAPAFVASLALQGIFRGFKDTKTPVICLGKCFGNFTAVVLFPFFIYYCQMGVYGAAISTVISQYLVAFSMIWNLNKRAVLLPPKLGELQFGDYLKSGGFLIGRTLAVLLTMTLGTSMAARQGPIAMAAHQICLQVWLAVSLLTDALATSAQALIASYVSRNDYRTVRDITQFVLKIGFGVGVFLALVLGVSFSSLAELFTKDTQVLGIVRTVALFVSASQPINALAFIFDGLHYGVSDFPYAAHSMMVIGAVSSAYLLRAPTIFGLPGVWSGLTLFMGLRMVAGFIRLLSHKGPWWFLHVNEAKELKKRNIGIEQIRICYSPFSRTSHTAKVVASVLDVPFDGSQCKAMEDLRERYFGCSFELMSHDKYPEIWAMDEKDPFTRPEEGESVADVVTRLTRALTDMESEFEDCTVLIVSHGDPLQILQTMINAAAQTKTDSNDLTSRIQATRVPSVLSQHRKFALNTGELRELV